MKSCNLILILSLAFVMLAGCGAKEETPAPAVVEVDDGGTYTSDVLDTSYEDALPVSTQLALGTMNLEEMENAVTPEQAGTLLPLWQALQGGVEIEAEVNAVLAQIETAMTAEQLEAIAAMELSQSDFGSLAQSLGGGVRGAGGGQELSDEERASRQAEFGNRSEMSAEERSAFIATRQAEFGNMSEEDRAAMRATAEAGGANFGGGGGRPGAGGLGGLGFMLNPLVELLTGRAAE